MVPVPGEATGIVVAFDHVKPCVVGPQFLVKNGCDIDECQPKRSLTSSVDLVIRGNPRYGL
jgi:hypothetical protein